MSIQGKRFARWNYRVFRYFDAGEAVYAPSIAAHLGIKRDFVEDVMDELDNNPPPVPTTDPIPEPPKETTVLTVEIEWAEPPATIQRGRGKAEQNDAIVAELKRRPGVWAAVQRGMASAGCTTWTKRGCEAVGRRGQDSPGGGARYDIYARWPA